MKLFILNKDFEIEGMLEEYNSVEWVRRYDEPGDFVLSAVATNGRNHRHDRTFKGRLLHRPGR